MFRKQSLWLIIVTLVAVILIPAAGLLTAQSTTITSQPCPLNMEYWKANPAAWRATAFGLGSELYTQPELLAMLNASAQGDTSLLLAQQLITAKLNVVNGADFSPINTTLIEADRLLANFTGKLPYAVLSTSQEGQSMLVASSTFDSYNQGLFTINCLAPTTITPVVITPVIINTPVPVRTVTPIPTPVTGGTDIPKVTVVIEGPVQAVNQNIITVYNLMVVLDLDDPIVQGVEIGDIVRVAGDLTLGSNNTVIIIATEVTVLNTEVVVNDDGQVWRDDNTCKNPPPDWAPANGWRRRCEDENSDNSGNNGQDDKDKDSDKGKGSGKGNGKGNGKDG